MRVIRDFKFFVQERIESAKNQFDIGLGDGTELDRLEAGLQFINWLERETLRREWQFITWSDLESLLKRDYPDGKYESNPVVCLRPGSEEMYCFITTGGSLQVGPYFNNDSFPRGCDLFISSDRRSWR